MDTREGIVLPVEQKLRFHGSGAEYFGIWIVNLLLTILTLGIYSAWAKVRRLRYFYGQTELAGARFEYHGRPGAILLGRAVALLLFVAYSLATEFISIWTPVVLVALAVILPWLLRNSFRFRMHNSSYRGIRFSFRGSTGAAYEVFLLHGIFMVLTLYLAGPLFHQRLKQYQHGNTRFGTARFGFDGSVGQFYRAYLPIFLLLVLAFAAPFAVIGGIVGAVQPGTEPDPVAIASAIGLMFVAIVAATLLITPLWQSRLQNLIWNRTRLGEHRFVSTLTARRLLWLHLSNFVAIVLSFGLFTPWAAVRMARYRAESLTLIPAGDIEAFIADQSHAVGAVGEETAEIFDFDIGL